MGDVAVGGGVGYERLDAHGRAGVRVSRGAERGLDRRRHRHRHLGELAFRRRPPAEVYGARGQRADAAGVPAEPLPRYDESTAHRAGDFHPDFLRDLYGVGVRLGGAAVRDGVRHPV